MPKYLTAATGTVYNIFFDRSDFICSFPFGILSHTPNLHLVYALACFAKVLFNLHKHQSLHYCITFLLPAYSYPNRYTEDPSLGPSSVDKVSRSTFQKP